MPKNNENIQLPFIGPLTPTEPEGFTPDQMVRCDECLRANPPTRVSCLYCGSALPATEESQKLRKPTLRPPNKHQIGYNSIYLPVKAEVDAHVVETAAELLKISAEEFQKMVTAQMPLPIARTGSREDAALVNSSLSELGLQSLVVSDMELMPQEHSIMRVRALALDQNGFTTIQSAASDTNRFAWSDVVLIVNGRLLQKTVELTERKSRGSENEIVNSSEFHSDEAVIDLYVKDSLHTWRIVATGFDFSCLQSEKTLMANENIVRLLRVLTQNCANATVDDSYRTLRQLLQLVWPAEAETTSKGWRRQRPGQVSLAAAAIESNETQFNRYSRLRFRFCGGEQK